MSFFKENEREREKENGEDISSINLKNSLICLNETTKERK